MSCDGTDTRALRRDTIVLTLVALGLRCSLALWAMDRFPPAGDGQYYHVVAERIARGLGYTWQWPDGVVTYAAHYPVGYPALLGGLYALWGPRPVLAMILNAVAGAAIVASVHRIAIGFAGRRVAATSAVIAIVHPTLLFYTPAMMTELVSAAIAIGAAALALRPPNTRRAYWATLAAMGLLLGLATLVRPQQLLFAPFLALLFALLPSRWAPGGALGGPGSRWRSATVAVAVVCGLSAAVCLPWTVRNCERMDRCVFVSANAGWNLLIGTSAQGNGAWTSLDSVGVPPECRDVFAEAAKDECFGKSALNIIRRHPLGWLRLVPAKLERTFDDVGAPGWYLNSSNWHYFDDRAKVGLGAAEVLFQRTLMAGALVAVMRVGGPLRRVRVLFASIGIAGLFYTYAWLSLLLLCGCMALLGRRLLKEPALLCLGFAVVTTASIHSVFFGGARYAIGVIPFLVVGSVRAWGAGRSSPRRALNIPGGNGPSAGPTVG